MNNQRILKSHKFIILLQIPLDLLEELFAM